MKKIISIFIILFVFFFYPLEGHAQQQYYTINIGSISNLPLHADYAEFPLGDVNFANIPFQIPVSGNNFFATHNIACPTCPKDATLPSLNISQAKNLYILVNSSDTFIPRFEGSNYASVYLNFTNNRQYRYDFITGNNIREWLESGNYGPTVNTVTSLFSREVWRGFRPNPLYSPNGEYPAIADLLKIPIPPELNTETLLSIYLKDDSLNRIRSSDPGLIVKGVTVEQGTPDLPTYNLSLTTEWDRESKQVPIDRTARVTVKVADQNGEALRDVVINGEVLSGAGVLNTLTATTIENGEAYFVLTPTALGDVDLKFTVGDQTSTITLHAYRPPVLIVPGMGASLNLPKFFSNLPFTNFAWTWSPTARDGWDDIISLLEGNNYGEGSGYKIAFYDWRKTLNPGSYADGKSLAVKESIDPAISDLLRGRPAGQRVNILAHSYGGVVARAYLQTMNYPQVNRLLTFATPHYGSSNIYWIWEGGTMPPVGDSMFRVITDSILKIYTHRHYIGSLSPIHSEFSGFLNLLPIYDNYVKVGQIFRPTNQLGYQNDVLNSSVSIDGFNTKVDTWNIAFTPFYSREVTTLRDVSVEAPITGAEFWRDGKPLAAQTFAAGDNSVLEESAQIPGYNSVELTGEHGDVPDMAVGYVESMLRMNSAQKNGKKAAKNMLGAVMMSPATVEIRDSIGSVLSESVPWGDEGEKFAYAADISPGLYSFVVKGTGVGPYTLYIPFAGENAYWNKEFSGNTYENKQEEYPLLVDTRSGGGGTLVRQSGLRLRIGGLNVPRRLVPVTFIFDIPDGFPTSQLQTSELFVNGSYIPILSSTLQKNERRYLVDVNGIDVGRAISWNDSAIVLQVAVPGASESLAGSLTYQHNWSGYRKFQ